MAFFVFAFVLAVGLGYLCFAFVDPPEFLRHTFKVPTILRFLPDRLFLPVGRLLMGAGLVVGAVAMARELAIWPPS